MKNNKLIIVIQLALFLVVKGASAQQTVHRANEFNLGLSGSGFSINPDDFIARDKISLKPECEAQSFTNTHTNFSIDKTQQYPASYQTVATSQNPNPESESIDIPINTALPIGSLAGNAVVSASGTASYGFSIYTPPGTNNMGAQVGISYNSNAFQGIFGKGWSLNAISTITRIPKSIYPDGERKNIQLDATDLIALDGNRLVRTAVGANTFRPQREDFSLITDEGDWFTVITKDGIRMEYGKTTDAKLILTNQLYNSVTLTWYLNKVTDTYGNYVTYSYNNDQGEITLKEIAFTGNDLASIVPYNFVRFYYDKKLDASISYVAGNALKKSLIMREIEVFCEGKSMKRYKFNYVFNKQTFLREVTEFGADNTHLNSTFFRYGDDGGGLSEIKRDEITTSTGAVDSRIYDEGPLHTTNNIFGDFNGDGRSDEVSISVNSNGTVNNHLDWRLWLNDEGVMKESNQSDADYPASASILDFHYFSPSSINTNGSINFAQSLDIDGDGMDDLVFASTHNSVSTVAIYYSNGHGFKQGPSVNFAENAAFLFADIDGNGQPEGIVYHQNTAVNVSAEFEVHNFTNNTILTNYTNLGTNHFFAASIPFVADPAYFNFSVVDFEGDGKQEIIASRSGVGTCFIRIRQVNTMLETEEFYNTPPSLNCSGCQMGDFNGDGISDFSYLGNEVSNLLGRNRNIKYGTGSGYVDLADAIVTSAQSLATGSIFAFFVFDVNMDGIDDLIKIHNNGLYYNFFVYYSGKGSAHPLGAIPVTFNGTSNNAIIDSASQASNNHELSRISVGDLDGDGHRDFFITQLELSQTNSGCSSSAVKFVSGNSLGLLFSIKDGYRNQNIFTYKTLSNGGPSVYVKGSGESFPFIDEQSPQYVVSKLESTNGIGGMNYTTYKYEGLKSHKQGLGSLGFDKMTTYTSSSNTLQELTHNPADASTFFERTPQISKTFLLQSQGNPILLSERTFITTFESIQSGSRFLSNLTKETLVDKITDANNVTSYVYDSNNGMLTEKHTDINSGFQITDEIYTPYTTTTGSWIPNKILSAIFTTKRGQEPTYSRSNSYIYDAKGSLSSTTSDPGTANEVSTSYIYDAITGVMLSTSTSSVGLTTKTASTSYDIPYQRFPVTATNSLNQTSEAKYDPRWGKPIWQKGIDGLVSEAFYDGYGRGIKTISPGNTTTSQEMAWVGINEIDAQHPFDVDTKSLFSITTKSTGSPTSKVYFDCMGRKLFTIGEGYGKFIYSAQAYNAMGSIIDATSSYDEDMLDNSALTKIVYSHTSFDNFNRVAQTSSTDGTTSLTVEYINTYPGNGMSKTKVIAPDGKTNSKTTDAMGSLIESEDDAGTKLTYAYYSSGQLKNTSLAGTGIVKSMEYTWGRLTRVDDKNSGITLTGYNAFGLPISQTDAKNQTWQCTYDVLDRMRTKTCPEGTYTYNYVTTGNGINLPLSVIAPNGNKVEYKYDYLNRPVSKLENVHGQEFTTQLVYNSDNRLQKFTYPGGFSVDYLYDSNGYNIAINRSDNGAPIWRIGEVSAAGQFTKYTLGNNAQSENTFTNFGFLFESKTAGVQDLTYTFDATNGNMMQRKDLTRNLTEDFTYDNLDRLTTIKLNNALTGSLSYQANGNIDTKSDLGQYTYGAKPNAVVSVEDPDNIINSAIQDITYTSFNKVNHLEEGNYKLDLTYGASDERKRSILTNSTNNSVLCERFYLDGFEKTIQGSSTYEITYINTPTGQSAIYVKENGASVGTMHYLYSDNLGSFNTLIDDAGNKIEQSYDAWGNKRNPGDWTSSNVANVPAWLYRGYTGHEHLNEFALINMNGRMYDPIVARFLSPDKLLQDPTNTQNYNGYSYVMNNPLRYSDPSGWAYQGYQFLSLNFSSQVESARNGGEDTGWDPNQNKGYAIDGVPCSRKEYQNAVADGGTIHMPGVEVYYVVTQADGTVVKTEDAGEAVDLYNENNNGYKVSFDTQGNFIYNYVEPSVQPETETNPSVPEQLSSDDPQDNTHKETDWYELTEGIKQIKDVVIDKKIDLNSSKEDISEKQKQIHNLNLRPLPEIETKLENIDYLETKLQVLNKNQRTPTIIPYRKPTIFPYEPNPRNRIAPDNYNRSYIIQFSFFPR